MLGLRWLRSAWSRGRTDGRDAILLLECMRIGSVLSNKKVLARKRSTAEVTASVGAGISNAGRASHVKRAGTQVALAAARRLRMGGLGLSDTLFAVMSREASVKHTVRLAACVQSNNALQEQQVAKRDWGPRETSPPHAA